MKKLLLVLMVVALAAFLLVGCNPVTPPPDGEEGEVEICPTVEVESQVAVGGKNIIKGGEQTITVTFAVPTEPVSVYVGDALKTIPTGTTEVVMYANADKTVYTGDFVFSTTLADDCFEAYIYVETCDACAYCKYPYTVDTVPPKATVEICLADCTCAGCEVVFSSDITTDTCDPDLVLCDDACSGFASWSIDIYDKYPFDVCCDVPCYEPIESDSGVCPIDFTTSCLASATSTKTVYAVVTLVDNVGNDTKFGADITFNPDTCTTIAVTPWAWHGIDSCTDTPTFVVCSSTSKLTATINTPVAK